MLHYIALNGFFQFPGQLYTLSLRLLQVSNYKYKTSHAVNQITICPTFLSSQAGNRRNYNEQSSSLYLVLYIRITTNIFLYYITKLFQTRLS